MSLKTVEEYNKEAAKSKVSMYFCECEPTWKATGLACSCGCGNGEILEEDVVFHHSNNPRIKCSITGKFGRLYYDATPRQMIRKIEWEA